MGLGGITIVGIVALLALFNIVIHLGFASATSLASALIPIVIALVVSMDSASFNGPGLVLIMQFVISFGFLLPISAPQNMLAYGTNRSEEHTSELQSRGHLVCRLLLEKKKPPRVDRVERATGQRDP